jgi:hypothetical protein
VNPLVDTEVQPLADMVVHPLLGKGVQYLPLELIEQPVAVGVYLGQVL